MSSRNRVVLLVGLLCAALVVVLVWMWRTPEEGGTAGDGPTVQAPASEARRAAETKTTKDAAPPVGHAAVEAARMAQEPLVRSREFGRLFREWFGRDAEAALAYLRQLPTGAQRTLALQIAIEQTNEQDPRRALALARGLAQTREEAFVYALVFATLVNRDRELALREWRDVPAGRGREMGLRAVVDRWAAEDAGAALRWAQTLEGAERAVAIESVVTAVVRTDPMRAAELAQQSLSGAALTRVLTQGIHQLAEVDPAKAATLVRALPAGEPQTGAVALVARAWGRSDPRAALAWAQGVADEAVRAVAMQRVLESWAVNDAAAAGQYALGLTDARARHAATLAVAAAMAGRDPSAAIAWASVVPQADTRAEAMAGVVDTWARHDPGAAARWASRQSEAVLGGKSTPALQAALSYWVIQEPSAVQEFIRGLPPARQVEAAGYAAPFLAQRDPERTMTWATSLPDTAAASAAMAAAFARWRENEPTKARAWLEKAVLSPALKAKLSER